MPYIPGQHTASNKPYAAYGTPDSARYLFYDPELFLYRPYNNTGEVNGYLNTPQARAGNITVLINISGVLTEYWYRDGTEDSDLIEKVVEPDLSAYYTKSNLQTGGQAEVNWDNITEVPGFVDLVSAQTVGGDKEFSGDILFSPVVAGPRTFRVLSYDNSGTKTAALSIVNSSSGTGSAYVQMYLDTPTKNGSIGVSEGGSVVEYLDMQFGVGETGIGIRDDTFLKGIVYNDNYSEEGTLDDRWIPDYGAVKAYADSQSVLIAIDQGNGVGYRLRNTGLFSIGQSAFDLSHTQPPGYGASGNNSIAIGSSSEASSTSTIAIGNLARATVYCAVAIGYNSKALGEHSFAGPSAIASGNSSIAFGTSEAAGSASIAIGRDLISNADSGFVIGRYNDPILPAPEDILNPTSPLFIIGNGRTINSGADIIRSNAYVILGNGTSTQYGIASYGADYSEDYTDRSIPDTEWVISQQLVEKFLKGGMAPGWRINGANPANYGVIGVGSIDFSYSSSASSTKGATGNFSFAAGIGSTASGNNSFAIGNTAIAGGGSSVAIGFYSNAMGDATFVAGDHTTSNAYACFSAGFYNDPIVLIPQGTDPVDGDPLFILGNGQPGNLSNAFVVFNDGTALHSSDVEVGDSASGVILKSPNGTRYRITVEDGGTLSVDAA